MAYRTVAVGERRTFSVTLGLRAGYNEGSFIHHSATADEVISRWMEARARQGLVVISGYFTEIKPYYMRDEAGNLQARHEPGLCFLGHVSVRRHEQTSDETIFEVLNDLADTLGKALGQEDVIVTYRDQSWIRGEKTA